jgi:drug/metabolite transporter (DMT)-like permease
MKNISEFFVTLLAALNGFIVVVLGFFYFGGMKIHQNLIIAILLLVLGVGGIVFAYIDRFHRRKAQQAVLASKISKKPK